MAVAKINLNGNTWIDLTNDTVAANNLATGETAHGADGEPVVGEARTAIKEKQINFIDYDGTLLYSYTAEEWEDVTALPANPSHDGLVAQGWNWTLQDISNQLTADPTGNICIGQNYITQSGDTEIDFTLYSELRRSPYLGIAVNGEVEVDWGDSSAKSTITGSSLTTKILTQHIYSSIGSYTISIHVVSGSFAFYDDSSLGYYQVLGAGQTTANKNSIYSTIIDNIRIGNNAIIGDYAFYNCSPSFITLPNTLTSIGIYSFYGNAGKLKSISLPSGMTSIPQRAFYNSQSLLTISIPYSVNTISNNAFMNTQFVNISIPYSVNTINGSAFYGVSLLKSAIIKSNGVYDGSNIFRGAGLQSVTIEEGVVSITGFLLALCYNLPIITIPSTVTTIGNNAFGLCYGLAKVRFEPTTPPSLGNANVFEALPIDCIISVPTGSLTAYTTATNYPDSNTYTYIEE